MIPFRLDQVASAVGGQLGPGTAGEAIATGLVIDSRAAGSGMLFAALGGERTDGHEHAEAAIFAGAVAVLATRPVGVPAIIVPDVAAAMATLATQALRAIPDITVIGLTGSSGKTSTKDLVAALLEPAGATVSPPGSFNNDLGVPLTVLQADAGTRFLVLEMGARGPGHIARLCGIAPPSIGVVLNVGSAHLGEFGGRQVTAESKAELAAAARDVAVLNADDELVAAMAARTSGRVVTFGLGPDAGVRARRVVMDARGRAAFVLESAAGSAPVTLQLIGAHHVSNALAAAAVALECGRTAQQTAEALSAALPRSRWRMEVRETPGGVTVVNDAYNANPESMTAALKTLAVLGQPVPDQPKRRTVAVLGPMYELGPASAGEHEAIGRLAVRLGVDKLVVVGPDAAAIHTGAGLEGMRGSASALVGDVSAALAGLADELRAGDVVLIKASRAAGLERVAAALLAGTEAAAASGAVPVP